MVGRLSPPGSVGDSPALGGIPERPLCPASLHTAPPGDWPWGQGVQSGAKGRNREYFPEASGAPPALTSCSPPTAGSRLPAQQATPKHPQPEQQVKASPQRQPGTWALREQGRSTLCGGQLPSLAPTTQAPVFVDKGLKTFSPPVSAVCHGAKWHCGQEHWLLRDTPGGASHSGGSGRGQAAVPGPQ